VRGEDFGEVGLFCIVYVSEARSKCAEVAYKVFLEFCTCLEIYPVIGVIQVRAEDIRKAEPTPTSSRVAFVPGFRKIGRVPRIFCLKWVVLSADRSP